MKRKITTAEKLCETMAVAYSLLKIHGKTCDKAPHLGTGHLHGPEDDQPFDVDGLLYCGRCHEWLP